MDLFNLQVVILEIILYLWCTHTVMGTEIRVNPHGESIPNLKNPENQFSTYAQRIGCNKKKYEA